jgi:hypothetical protein
MFDSPDAGSGDLFTNADHVGDLLVIKVDRTELGVQTENGPADVIRADVSVINRDGTIGDTYVDAMLFGKVLFGQLKRKAGRTVVGVFQGEPGVKRNGKSVPYTLDAATPEQNELAVRAMTSAPEPATAAVGGGSDAPPWERS